MRIWLRRWGPALLVMAAIFAASSQSKSAVPDLGAADWPVKKAGHLLMYGVLAACWMRGLAYGRPANGRDALWAIVLSTLYGASDEFHQSFVPGRGATVIDVVIDGVGAILGAGLTLGWQRSRRQRKP